MLEEMRRSTSACVSVAACCITLHADRERRTEEEHKQREEERERGDHRVPV
jgi:hypothetical protein